MTRHDVILRALIKVQGFPLEAQASMVETFLEVAGELSCDSADSGASIAATPIIPPPLKTNLSTGTTAGIPSPLIIASSMDEIPRLEIREAMPEGPFRTYSQLVAEVMPQIPKTIDVLMVDGKTLRVGLRTVPSEDAKIVRVTSYVPTGPDQGADGPCTVFTMDEKDLRVEEKLRDVIAAGVRAQFVPRDQARSVQPSIQVGDFRTNCVKAEDEPHGTPMRQGSGEEAPKSMFHQLVARVSDV